MPSLLEHCTESLRLFGGPYKHIHEWLDEFAGKPPHGMRHRQFRHHQEGVDKVRRLWGDIAAKVARAHIVADLKMEGWTDDKPFPMNCEHYNQLGFF